MRTLNAAGEHGFPAQERPDEEMRVRQPPTFAREPAYCLVGAGECGDEFSVPSNRWR